jgi:hypothetical protein
MKGKFTSYLASSSSIEPVVWANSLEGFVFWQSLVLVQRSSMKAFFERCAKLQGSATTDFCSTNTYKKTQQRSFKADPKSLLKTLEASMQYQASASIQDKMSSPCWVCYKEVFFF